jgi:hypothetical protein
MGAEGAERSHHHGVAVGRRVGDLLGGMLPPAPPWFSITMSGQPELKPLRHQPRRGVGRTAGRERHHQLDRFGRIGLGVATLATAIVAAARMKTATIALSTF